MIVLKVVLSMPLRMSNQVVDALGLSLRQDSSDLHTACLSSVVNLIVADSVVVSIIRSLVSFSVSFRNLTGFPLNVD